MRTRLIALLAIGTLAFVGCATDEPSLQPPTDDATAETSPTPADDAGFTLQVIEHVPDDPNAESLGEILADEDGFVLYLRTSDPEGGSTCTEGCAETWPPLTVDGEAIAGPGIDADQLDTFEREDGSTQVAIDGHALYTYTPDTEPGQASGQGVGGVWFAVTPAGDQAG